MSRTKTTPKLTDDPTTVALLRDLYAHARHVGARHGTFGWAGLGGRVAGWEHVWTDGVSQVSIDDGWMRYTWRKSLRICVRVTSVAEAARLLAAAGVLPEQFAQGGESR